MNKKIAVVLLNLGGPNSLKEVKQFLFNLFYDKAIIRLPNPLRWIIAKIISSSREKTAIEIYKKIGGKSTILAETENQRKKLEEFLNKDQLDAKVFIAMRYSSPRSYETMLEIKRYNPAQIILLPLYPQFSSTTTKSSVDEIMMEIKQSRIDAEVKTIGCFFTNDEFIESHVNQIKSSIKKLKTSNYIMLFSAHGLPEKFIKAGDPYQWQVEETVKSIVQKLDIKNLEYKITYQSRVGPMKWIGPYTDIEIEDAALKGKAIVVIPVAFVSEHSETLVELDIEYAEIAHEHNVEYIRVNTLSDDNIFISSLSKIVKKFTKRENLFVSSEKNTRICPEKFIDCICK